MHHKVNKHLFLKFIRSDKNNRSIQGQNEEVAGKNEEKNSGLNIHTENAYKIMRKIDIRYRLI